MTVKEFNNIFYPQYSKALEFVECFEHALQKCDDNTIKQMQCIGWDKGTKEFLIDSINRALEDAKDGCKWNQAKWWKEE